jgi:hypothetical protein
MVAVLLRVLEGVVNPNTTHTQHYVSGGRVQPPKQLHAILEVGFSRAIFEPIDSDVTSTD